MPRWRERGGRRWAFVPRGFFVRSVAGQRQTRRVSGLESDHPVVLPTHTPALFAAAVERAAQCLRAGEVVALPTETVYGLAANALEADAVAKLFAIKGRPAHNPIIVHVASLEMARRCVTDWPAAADRLAAAFWPGPLTLVLPRSGVIPDIVTAGGPTVGVRWPGHPLMQAVIRACGFPLAAPSANVSGQLSPTSAAHVLAGLGGRVRLIVDGGRSQVGIESTVLDLTTDPPRVLRPGMIHGESLQAVLAPGETPGARNHPRLHEGETPPRSGLVAPEAASPPAATGSLRSPGLLPKHYAPRARLVVLSWRDDADLRAQLAACGAPAAATHVLAHACIPGGDAAARVCVMPHDAEAFARALYAELHRCDAEGAAWIVVEAVPAEASWAGIADRLRRAAR